nr:immunoglobulin heavy chain junction region [Macaca mulatta]
CARARGGVIPFFDNW